MNTDSSTSRIRFSIPVSVILERRIITRSFWSLPSWYLHTVAIGEHLVVGESETAREGAPAGRSERGELFAWTGFQVTLYKDACERYWHALIGNKPLVYVVCRDDADDVDGADNNAQSLVPIAVTIDYDEASASAETDDPVLSMPIPGQLYRSMETFVLEHYEPKVFKKRKRRKWADEQSHGSRPESLSNRHETRRDS